MNQKGISNILSYILVIFISIIVLSVIVIFAQKNITKNQEIYEFEEMIKSMNKMANTINNVINARFSAREINVYNAGELSIKCNENKIIGKMEYQGKIKDNALVSGVKVYRVGEEIVIEKSILSEKIVNIECNEINFNKGKSKWVFSYQMYDSENEKIKLSIEPSEFSKE